MNLVCLKSNALLSWIKLIGKFIKYIEFLIDILYRFKLVLQRIIRIITSNMDETMKYNMIFGLVIYLKIKINVNDNEGF